MKSRRSTAVFVCVVISLLLATRERTFAQNIDALFRQFNAANDAEDYAQAERYANQMLTASPTPGWQVASLNNLGRVCHNLRRYEEAERHFKRGMAIQLAADNVNGGWMPSNLGRVYKDQKRFDEAEQMFRKAQQFFEGLKGTNSAEYATVTGNFAALRHDQGRYKDGEALAQRAYDIRKAIYGEAHADTASSMVQLADMSRHLEEFEKSEQRYRAALAQREKIFGADHPQVANSHHYLAVMFRDSEKWPDAEKAERQALRIREQKLGLASAATKESLESLATYLEKQGKEAEAAELRSRVKPTVAADGDAPNDTGKLRIKSSVASVYDGQTVITEVKADEEYSFTRVSGKSYLITVNLGGRQRLGWVKGQDVEIVPTVSLASLPSAWQLISPPRSRFKAAFPVQPKVTNQTINSTTSYTFTAETSGTTYFVSYFDLPANMQLSFDSGINAFVNARKGTVKTRKNYELDLYPGREVVVELPESNFCRLRLLTVNRRWYQIGAEGGADVINDDEAAKFFASFALAD